MPIPPLILRLRPTLPNFPAPLSPTLQTLTVGTWSASASFPLRDGLAPARERSLI